MSSEANTTNPFPFLVTARRPTAIALGVLALAFFSCAIWWGLWGMSGYKTDDLGPDAKTTKLGDPNADLEKEKSKDSKKDGAEKTHSVDYIPAAIWAGLVGFVFAAGCGWLITHEIDATNPGAAARLEALTFGSSIGLLTTVLGFVLGVKWWESLANWVNKNDAREAKWIFFAVCIFFVGLTIMFFSTQLGRAEQRNNVLLRRLMYGFNSVLHGILILILLVGANVAVFLKVPTTFVANDAAFTALSDQSKTFLRSIDQPVKAYLIMPEKFRGQIAGLPYDNLYMDTRGLLGQCEDVSKFFKAEYLSPSLDKAKISSLYAKLKIKDQDQLGILLVVGDEDGSPATGFVQAEELMEFNPSETRAPIVYQGENKLLSELAYMTDSRSKMAVYFTQNHGEMSMDPGGQPDRSISNIITYLKARKIRTEALKLDPAKPKIPEDAALVVIAGPRQTITPTDPLIKALTEYLRPSAPGAPSGKLMAFLPAFRGVDGRVGATGLEQLLAEVGVAVDPSARLVTIPNSLPAVQGRTIPPDYLLGGAYEARHPLFELLDNAWLVKDVRVMRPLPQQNPAFRVTPLVGTQSRRYTWQETDYATSPAVAFEAIKADLEGPLPREKKLSPASQVLGMAVSAIPPNANPEKPPQEKARMLIFASDTMLADQPAFDLISPDFRQQFVAGGIDWLREREASIGIAPRAVNLYKLPRPIELSSQFILLAMITIGIAALGVAVWFSRRR